MEIMSNQWIFPRLRLDSWLWHQSEMKAVCTKQRQTRMASFEFVSWIKIVFLLLPSWLTKAFDILIYKILQVSLRQVSRDRNHLISDNTLWCFTPSRDACRLIIFHPTFQQPFYAAFMAFHSHSGDRNDSSKVPLPLNTCPPLSSFFNPKIIFYEHLSI